MVECTTLNYDHSFASVSHTRLHKEICTDYVLNGYLSLGKDQIVKSMSR